MQAEGEGVGTCQGLPPLPYHSSAVTKAHVMFRSVSSGSLFFLLKKTSTIHSCTKGKKFSVKIKVM